MISYLFNRRWFCFADLVPVRLPLRPVEKTGHKMEVRIEVTGNLKLFALDEADGYTQGRLPQLVLQLLLELLGRYSGFVINL